MPTSFPTFVDTPDGEEPEPGTPDVDAAYLNSVNGAVNEIENTLPGKVDASELATVAVTGAYTDLIGPPAIPNDPGDIGAQPAGDYATNTALAGKANTSHTHALADVTITGTPNGSKFLRDDGTWAAPTQTGVSDHGELTGLADDDHTQYHNDTRGDVRYYPRADVDTALATKAATVHAHGAGDITSGTIDIARIPTGSTSTTVPLGNHTHSAPDTATYETWNFTPRTQAVSGATANVDVGVAGDLQVTVTTVSSTTLTPTNGQNGRVCLIECLASGAERTVALDAAVKLTDGVASRSLTIPSGRVGVFLIRASNITGSMVYELASAYLRAA